MLLDSMQEYLAIDVNATTGDTVAGVLVGFSTGSDPYYEIKSVIVDSVLVIENNGINVTRQFVHAIGWSPLAPYIEYYMFWQAGIGNSIGPLLQLGMVYGNTLPRCLRVQDNYIYSDQSGDPGLPGIPCDCSLSPLGVEDRPALSHSVASPNPSIGLFTLSGSKAPSSVSVYTYTGQLVWKGSGTNIDLTSQQPGVYSAVVASGQSSQAIRLMVVR